MEPRWRDAPDIAPTTINIVYAALHYRILQYTCTCVCVCGLSIKLQFMCTYLLASNEYRYCNCNIFCKFVERKSVAYFWALHVKQSKSTRIHFIIHTYLMPNRKRTSLPPPLYCYGIAAYLAYTWHRMCEWNSIFFWAFASAFYIFNICR